MGFPKQQQQVPGVQSAMSPVPDCGENSYRGSGRLTGKRAVITGGDSGIGRAVAIAYAREGADVLIAYLNEDEDAAELMGVPTFRFKLIAFAIGAAIGGLSGALFAGKSGFINPQSFELLLSILFLAAVVVGGSMTSSVETASGRVAQAARDGAAAVRPYVTVGVMGGISSRAVPMVFAPRLGLLAHGSSSP